MTPLIILLSFMALLPHDRMGGSPGNAWPQIMLFHGSGLGEPVAIAGVAQTKAFLDSLEPIEDGDLTLDERPWIEVALFWNPRWAVCARDPACPDRLALRDAEERATYYPGWRATRAVFSRGNGDGVVGPAGLQLLEERGIPVIAASNH